MNSSTKAKNKANIIKARNINVKEDVLSDTWKKMAGILNKKRAKKMTAHIEKVRNEWERQIDI